MNKGVLKSVEIIDRPHVHITLIHVHMYVVCTTSSSLILLYDGIF